MVDFHSHILYGVDDGSESREMSVTMINQSIRDGVTHLALTPHHIEGVFTTAMDRKEDYIRKYKDLQREFAGRITLIPSVEIMYHDRVLDEIEKGTLMGYGAKKVVLVEYNLTDYPQSSEAVFYEMKKKGYQVILAHPERNTALQDDVEILYHLHDLGVLYQLNAGSLRGQFGNTAKYFAEKLIRKNLIHAVGSDGHSINHRNMKVRHAYDRIAEINPALHENIMKNAIPLILGEEIEVLRYEPWVVEKKRKISWLSRRKKIVYE